MLSYCSHLKFRIVDDTVEVSPVLAIMYIVIVLCCVCVQTERDVSVRQRAADLLYAMCDRSNAKQIVAEMLSYLETADYSIREEMVCSAACHDIDFSHLIVLKCCFSISCIQVTI